MFTKAHAEENAALLARAVELLREAGYDPAKRPRSAGSSEQREFVRPYYDTAVNQLLEEFPGVPPQRVRARVVGARRSIDSNKGGKIKQNGSAPHSI